MIVFRCVHSRACGPGNTRIDQKGSCHLSLSASLAGNVKVVQFNLALSAMQAMSKESHPFQISRGSKNARTMTNSGLVAHFKAKHEKDIRSQESPAAESQEATVPIYDVNASRKRKNTILDMCAKKNRSEMFQMTIPGWVEAKTTLSFASEKAQRFHKSIFEMIVMDLLPFYAVAKPGFLRHQQITVPNFIVASPKYYRSLLDPAYENIKSKMKAKLEADSPPSISAGLDLWSKHHHGYMGKLS